jgi:hypothetical protein
MVASSINRAPLAATMTGSTTTGTPRAASGASTSTSRSTIAGDATMPTLIASTPTSEITASSWARTTGSGTGWTAVTPWLCCAVIAVITVRPWPPSMVAVLRSAWIPAPPPESEPAMSRTRAIIGEA